MHAFHEYLSKQLHDHLRKRRVVVWYDPNGEFAPYIDELLTNSSSTSSTPSFSLPIAPCLLPTADSPQPTAHCLLPTGLVICLVRFDGSFFGVRAAVEPLVAADQPEPLLIYLPGVSHDRTGSVLMELEKAGTCYEPQLKRLARNRPP